MWDYKCPKCRQSKIFSEPFELSKPLKMPKDCPYCKQRFEPEPGFYYGAMFLSYILSSWMLLLPTLLLVFYFKWSVFGAIFTACLLLALVYFRLLRGSRSLWLHFNIKHDKEAATKAKAEVLANT